MTRTTTAASHFVLFTLLALGCDADAQPAAIESPAKIEASPSAKADPGSTAPGLDAATAGTPAELGRPAAAPAPRPIVDGAESHDLLAQGGSTLAASISDGLRAANTFLGKPASAATPKASAAEPKAPKVAPRPSTGPRTETCDLRSYAWQNMRVQTDQFETTKLKKGSFSVHDKEGYCFDAELIGPQFADLDEDGRDEAYFVVSEYFSTADEEGCIVGMGSGYEALFAYTLDEKCRPKMLASVGDVGDCPMNPSDFCTDFRLQIRGDQVVYGRKRYAWKGAALGVAK